MEPRRIAYPCTDLHGNVSKVIRIETPGQEPVWGSDRPFESRLHTHVFEVDSPEHVEFVGWRKTRKLLDGE